MTTAALTWPEAVVYIAAIATVGLIITVLIWSIFRTGQTAIRTDSREGESIDNPSAVSPHVDIRTAD
jgi:hypothetical protein